MEQFDDRVQFILPDGFEVKRIVDEEGSTSFNILCAPYTDEDGERLAKYRIQVNRCPDKPLTGPIIQTKPVVASTNCISKDMSFLMTTINIKIVNIQIEYKSVVCSLTMPVVVSEGNLDQTLEEAVGYLNTIIASIEIDHVRVQTEALTVGQLLSSEIDNNNVDDVIPEFPVATPKEKQHTHFDFLEGTRTGLGFLGPSILINQNGTEMEFIGGEDMTFVVESPKAQTILEQADGLDQGGFELADQAIKMAELFRVDPSVFDMSDDREQEIRYSYIRRITDFDAFRSFAWTLSAYCQEKNMDPKDVDYETLNAIMFFVRNRSNLNFTANTVHCPTLTSGDDLHVFYLPDVLIKQNGKELLALINANVTEEGNPFGVASLEGLRRELSWLYPAMDTAYRVLSADRDRFTPLIGAMADVLYVWCSLTGAARRPFFTEDGPMNYAFDHPDVIPDWELQMEQYAERRRQEWLGAHEADLDQNCPIIFQGKKFVFSGVGQSSEWLTVLEKLIRMGGIQRTAVSGQTDYVVCDPQYAGDSAINAVKEQRIKGKCQSTHIILYDRFLEALGMPRSKQEPEQKKKEYSITLPEMKPEMNRPLPVQLTFQSGLSAKGSDYSLDIPDGFRIVEKEDGRDFIAWKPGENQDDWNDSDFVIFAGALFPLEMVSEFATIAEYEELAITLESKFSLQTGDIFEDTRMLLFETPPFPGAVIAQYMQDTIHAQILCSVSNGLRLLRLQINNVERGKRKDYDAICRIITEHFHTDKPIYLLRNPDDPTILSKEPTEQWLDEWESLIEDWINHYATARIFAVNSLATEFQERQDSTPAPIRIKELRRNIHRALKRSGDRFDNLLRCCEQVCTYYQEHYPNFSGYNRMNQILVNVAEQASHVVTFDGNENDAVKYDSEYAIQFKSHMGSLKAESDCIAEKKEKASAEILQQRTDEELKKQEARERYQVARANWEKNCEVTRAQREECLAARLSESRDHITADIERKHDEAINAAKAELEAQETRKRGAEATLASLGIFSFGAKKEQRRIIEDADRRMGDARTAITRAEDEYRTNRNNLEQQVTDQERKMRAEIEAELPLPEAPKDPDAPPVPSRPAPQMTRTQMENERDKQKILDYIRSQGKPARAGDISAAVGISGQKGSALLSQLQREGRVVKSEGPMRITLFGLPDMAEPLPKTSKDPNTPTPAPSRPAPQMTRTQMENERDKQKILDYIRSQGKPSRVGDISTAVGISGQKGAALLSQLEREGRVVKSEGPKRVTMFDITPDKN